MASWRFGCVAGMDDGSTRGRWREQIGLFWERGIFVSYVLAKMTDRGIHLPRDDFICWDELGTLIRANFPSPSAV